MLRRGGDEAAEGGDRALVVALAVLRIAEPEARRLGIAAAWVALQEAAVGAGRCGEIATAQHAHRFFELPLLLGVSQKLSAIDADLLRLDLAQARVHALLQVLLPALQLCQVARQLLVLAARLGQLGAQRFELTVELEQAAPQLRDLI